MLDTYSRSKMNKENYKSEYYDLLLKSNYATGLSWNYFISKYIDEDLHQQLLKMPTQQMLAFTALPEMLQVLVLIRSGYFYTANLLVSSLFPTVQEKMPALVEVAQWLAKSLKEADDTQEE